MQSTGFLGSTYPGVVGFQYPLTFHGGMMGQRPLGNSHGLVHQANVNSNAATFTGDSVSSGGQMERSFFSISLTLFAIIVKQCSNL